MDRLGDELKEDPQPLSLELRAGGLYDSRVESAAADRGRDVDDSALALSLAAGWRIPVTENFGFRLGYNGYTVFFRDLDEYNVVDQTATVEARWLDGRSLYSLPLGYGHVLKDGRVDHSRITLTPTYTRLFPRTRQALSFYGLYVNIKDRDDFVQDEDGRGLGAGCGYVFQFENRSRVGLSLAYQRITYDAVTADYGAGVPGLSDNRWDNTITAGADVYFPLSPYLGLFAGYIYTRNESNVETYIYERHIIQAGAALRFPALQ